jgi:hypothetical protein
MRAQLTQRCSAVLPTTVSDMILLRDFASETLAASFSVTETPEPLDSIGSLPRTDQSGHVRGHEPFISLLERWEGLASERALCRAVRRAQKVVRALC